MNLGRARIRSIDLVDQDNGLKPELERFQGYEPSLRHRALRRIDQQDHTVDHPEDALDLSAEVRVARCIDDVDLHILPLDRSVLRENGDPPLPFERVGVHHAFRHLLVLPEDAGLPEHLVDQGRLAVIDVRDDGDVADRHGLRGILPVETLEREPAKLTAFPETFQWHTPPEKNRCALQPRFWSRLWHLP